MKTILVVDDDKTFPDMVRSSLSAEAYTVISAPDGAQGLAMLQPSPPDLILLDIQMPHIGGIEFLTRMKAMHFEKQVPVIITSNDSSLATISEGTALGVRGYILKSNETLATIVELLKNILEKGL